MIYNFNRLLRRHNLIGNLFVWKDVRNKKNGAARFLLNKKHLQPGQTIVEASTGSMADALAGEAKLRGLNVIIFANFFNKNTPLGKNLSYAKVLTPVNPYSDVADILFYAEQAKAFARKHGYCYLGQFEDPNHCIYYQNILNRELTNFETKIDIYIDRVGTGATLKGFGSALKEKFPALEVYTENKDHLADKSIFLRDFNYKILPFTHEQINKRNFLRNEIIPELLDMFGTGNFEKSLNNIANALIMKEIFPDKTIFTTIGD